MRKWFLIVAIIVASFSSKIFADISISSKLTLVQPGGTPLPQMPDTALAGDGTLYFRYITPDENGQPGTGSMKKLPGSGGPVLNVWASTNQGSRLGRPTINTATNGVAFTDADASGTPLLISQSPGGPVITIHGDNFSSFGDPVFDSNGRRLFTGQTPAGNSGYILASDPNVSGGAIITIVGLTQNGYTTPAHVMSGNGDVISFRTQQQGSATPVIAQYVGGTVITISGSNWDTVSEPAGHGPNLVYSYGDSAGKYYVIGLTHGASRSPVQSTHPIITPTVNTGGLIVYGLGTDDGTPAVDAMNSIQWTSMDSSIAETLISVGDPLAGSTVTKLYFSPDSLNDNDQLAFYAELADGSSGLFLSSALPEPTSLGVIVISSAMLMRRRSRLG